MLLQFWANIYMARLENILKEEYKSDFKLKWSILFRRFVDDGFGVMQGNKSDVDYWVVKFNSLCESITIDKLKFGKSVEFMDL